MEEFNERLRGDSSNLPWEMSARTSSNKEDEDHEAFRVFDM